MKSLTIITLLSISLLVANAAFKPGPEEETMGNLPNCTLDTVAYSGYLDVTDTRKLHYVFIGS